MLRWLDGLNSTKAQPNENLGREFLELFALGEGHYSERDVREIARTRPASARSISQKHRDEFDPADFDDGEKTILGQTGRWGLDDVVRIACRQPAAAMHVARRLYRTFISDTDEPDARAARTSGRRHAPKETWTLPRASRWCCARGSFTARMPGERIKSPVALAIGAIRACEVFAPPPDLVELDIHLTRMGQRLFYPPNVAGWPGGLAWLGG